MGRYSFTRFEAVGQMLCREFGEELGERILQKIIRTLGEGERIMVPRYSDRGLQTRYFWLRKQWKSSGGNPGTVPNLIPKLFRGVLDILCRRLGDSTGVVMFKRIIVELGPGERLTVPFVNCNEERGTRDDRRKGCKRCMRMCFMRVRRNEIIRNKFTGFNHKELAIQFDLSERQVRRVVDGR